MLMHRPIDKGDVGGRVRVCDPSLTLHRTNYYGRTGTVTGRDHDVVSVVFDGETRHRPLEHDIAVAQLETITALPEEPTDMAVLMEHMTIELLRARANAQFGEHQATQLLSAAAARRTAAAAARRTRRAFCDIPDLLRRVEELRNITAAEVHFAYDAEPAGEIRSRLPRIAIELREIADALGLHLPDLDGAQEGERAA